MGFYPFTLTIGTIAPPLPVAQGGTGAVTAAAGLAGLGGLGLQAATAAAGFALQNATPAIISWAVPNDGNNHRVAVFASLDVTVAQTGGAVTVAVTDPGGTLGTHTLYAGGVGVGSAVGSTPLMSVKAGSSVSVAQSTAQTAGTSTLFCELWGL